MSKKNSKSAQTSSKTSPIIWTDTDNGGAAREDDLGTVTPTGKGKFTASVQGQALKGDTGSTRYFSSKITAMGVVDEEVAERGAQPVALVIVPEASQALSPEAQDAVTLFLVERQEAEGPKVAKTPVPARAPKAKKVGVIPEGYDEATWMSMTAGKKAAATRRAKGGLPPARAAKPAPEGYEATWSLLTAGQKAAITRRLNGNMPAAGTSSSKKSQAPEGFDEATWATLTAGRKAAITRQSRAATAA